MVLVAEREQGDKFLFVIFCLIQILFKQIDFLRLRERSYGRKQEAKKQYPFLHGAKVQKVLDLLTSDICAYRNWGWGGIKQLNIR